MKSNDTGQELYKHPKSQDKLHETLALAIAAVTSMVVHESSSHPGITVAFTQSKHDICRISLILRNRISRISQFHDRSSISPTTRCRVSCATYLRTRFHKIDSTVETGFTKDLCENRQVKTGKLHTGTCTHKERSHI